MGQRKNPPSEFGAAPIPGLVSPAESDGLVGAVGEGAQTGSVVDRDLDLRLQAVLKDLPGPETPQDRLAGPVRDAYSRESEGQRLPRPGLHLTGWLATLVLDIEGKTDCTPDINHL